MNPRRQGKSPRERVSATSHRLFIGVRPTGISYADRAREEHGDYARCAFLSFSTLALSFSPECPAVLQEEIRRDAQRVQACRGQQFPIDSCGHTVLLGGAS